MYSTPDIVRTVNVLAVILAQRMTMETGLILLYQADSGGQLAEVYRQLDWATHYLTGQTEMVPTVEACPPMVTLRPDIM